MNATLSKVFLMTIFLPISNHSSVFGFESNQDLTLDYDFTSKHPHITLNKGFSGFEKWGTWTDGPHAQINISQDFLSSFWDKEKTYCLKFDLGAHLPKLSSKIEAKILLENFQSILIFTRSSLHQILSIPLTQSLRNKDLTIDFHISGISSPFFKGNSKDQRGLGIAFKKLFIEEASVSKEPVTLVQIPKEVQHLPLKIDPKDIKAFEDFLKDNLDQNIFGWFAKIQIKNGEVSATPLPKDAPYLKIILSYLKQKIAEHNFSPLTFFIVLSDSFHMKDGLRSTFEKLCTRVPFLVCDKKAGYYKNMIFAPDFYLINSHYEKVLTEIQEKLKNIDLTQRIEKAGFIGSQTGGVYSMNTFAKLSRHKAVLLSKMFPEHLYVRFVSYDTQSCKDNNEEYKKVMTSIFGPPEPRTPFPQMLQYKYNISIDGNVAAWQRVPHIMFSMSALLLRANWSQFFYPFMKPYEHYIPLKEDLSDLISQIDYLKENPEVGEAIAQNALNFAKKNLTPHAIDCYYVELLKKISEKF